MEDWIKLNLLNEIQSTYFLIINRIIQPKLDYLVNLFPFNYKN